MSNIGVWDYLYLFCFLKLLKQRCFVTAMYTANCRSCIFIQRYTTQLGTHTKHIDCDSMQERSGRECDLHSSKDYKQTSTIFTCTMLTTITASTHDNLNKTKSPNASQMPWVCQVGMKLLHWVNAVQRANFI